MSLARIWRASASHHRLAVRSFRRPISSESATGAEADAADPEMASIEAVLRARGVEPGSVRIVATALKSTSSSVETRRVLAETLPLDAFKQMEQSMHDMFALDKPEDCTVTVRVQNENMREFKVKGRTGETFLDLVKRGTEVRDYLECACGGNMTCSTCHIYVREPKEIAQEASEEEKDMIDLAWQPDEDSRLGCQVKLRPDVKMVVEIPKQSNNYFK